MIKNLILDYNGVISNDFEFSYQVAMDTFKRLGAATVSYETFKDEFEIPAENFYSKYLGIVEFGTFRELYFDLYSKAGMPPVYTGVATTLQKLADQRIQMIVLSAHRIEKIKQELIHFGIPETRFAKIYGGAENKLSVMQTIVSEHRLDVKLTAYVGDTTHDIETAQTSGLISIASTYGYQSREKLSRLHPNFYIDSFKELLSIIQ